ncbi:MAG TPA: sugar phosphate nucleotidyltransferase [Chitinophagaceae bacterium]|jgi:NDP-sugar pyrophosphorylase family protein|nr:sugar phosphate nucleotidyltransferase [Chitinophagaceae bacterium]
MQAMIFSAGLGTRFKPWTDKHPKALAIVNGRSLLQRNIEYLQQQGIKDVIVNTHHLADQIDQAIIENDGWGSNVLVSDERDELLDTGGGLLKAKELFEPHERFITCNVDILTDLDISKLLRFHEEKNALISFAVSNRSTSRNLLFDKDDRLVGWRNNKTGEEKISIPGIAFVEKAYSCVVVFGYEIFNRMEEAGFSGKFSLIDVYLKLAAAHRIMGYDHTGDRFVDVGKPESVAIAESMF